MTRTRSWQFLLVGLLGPSIATACTAPIGSEDEGRLEPAPVDEAPLGAPEPAEGDAALDALPWHSRIALERAMAEADERFRNHALRCKGG